MIGCARRPAFTLIELLVVIAIIALLISILLPALSAAREHGRSAVCLANMHTLGEGLVIYQDENQDVFVPGRLPKIDDCNAYASLFGRRKYRPTFLAMASLAVGVPPFKDPKECRTYDDQFGERGDRQDYYYGAYICPSAREWTDERNGSYGYNYQFLGNSRLLNDSVVDSYKNWPVRIVQVLNPARVVAMADGMGTAAAVPPAERQPYTNNEKVPAAYGDEGFNLDPPRIDMAIGEIAGQNYSPMLRSGADPRHLDKTNVLWVDGHAAASTLEKLGYKYDTLGGIGLEGDNALWTPSGEDVPWTPDYHP